MKRLIITLCAALLLIGTQAFGQQFSVNAGYLNSAYKYSDSGYSMKVTGNGAFAGFDVDFASSNYPNFAITPGLYFDAIDYKVFDGVSAIEYYLRAPVHLKYVGMLSNETDYFLSAGPSFLVSLGGKSKASYGGVSYDEKVEGGDFEATFGLAGGLELSGNIRLSLGYDFGLTDNDDVRRNFFHVGIGYLF